MVLVDCAVSACEQPRNKKTGWIGGLKEQTDGAGVGSTDLNIPAQVCVSQAIAPFQGAMKVEHSFQLRQTVKKKICAP